MKSGPRRGRCTWLVVAAWPPELAHLRRQLATLSRSTRKTIVLETVGIGLVEAAAGAARAIAERQPQQILLVGTAGIYASSATPSLAIGTAAIVRRTNLLSNLLGDGHSYLPSVLPTEQPCSADLVTRLRKATKLAVVDVACPVGITASTNAARAAARQSGCAAENLEAFAVARAAARAGIPFAAVLGIANRVGPAAHAEWKMHARAAARAACQGALAFFRLAD